MVSGTQKVPKSYTSLCINFPYAHVAYTLALKHPYWDYFKANVYTYESFEDMDP